MMLSSSHDLSSTQFADVVNLLGDIALNLHQQRSIDDIVNVGVEAVKNLFGCDRALVYQILPDGDGVVLAEAVGADTPAIVGQLIHDPCLDRQWMEPYRQGRTSAVEDVNHSTLEACHIELLKQLQAKANLVAPIVVPAAQPEAESRLWGLLIVHDCHAPRNWQALHHQVLKHIGTHIGLALRHGQTQQQLEALQQRETRWQTALEAAEDGVWDWNAETDEVYFSHEWKTMLGYAQDDIGNTLEEWLSRVHPDDLAEVHQALHDHVAGHSSIYHSEHRVRAKDGTWRWVLDRGRVVDWTPDGKPLRIIGTHVDVSDRKQAEVALRESQEKYQTLFQTLPVGLSITDQQGHLVEVNAAAEHILEVSAEEHLQRGLSDANWSIIRPDGSPMAAADYPGLIALREGRMVAGVEMGIVLKPGITRWISVCAAPIPLPNYGVIIAYFDITSLKQAEHQVKLQSAALEACADGVAITDYHGNIEWVNPAFEGLTGYRPEEVFGKNPRDIVKSGQQDAAFYRQLWRQILGGQVWRGELVNRRKDGSLYCEEMTITPVRNRWGRIQHFVAIKQDVTERHRMDQRLRDRDEMLRKISEQVPGVIYQYRLDADGHSCFPYASEAIRYIYEVTPEQVQTDAQPVLDRLHPEDHHRVVESILASFNTLELWQDEYRVCLPERGVRWLEGHAIPEKLEDGSVLWHGYIWDITERKHMEAQIQREVQQERMITLIEHHIAQSLDLKTILQTTVDEVRQFIAADRVLIYHLYPDWRGLVMTESVEPGWMSIVHQEITDSYFALTQGCCYHDRHITVVEDIYTAGFSACHVELLEGMQVRAKLAVPIFQGTRLWGLLVAHQCQTPRPWQDSEIRLLQQLVNQLAIAIQHAELHDQLRVANEELENLSNTDALTRVNNRRCFDQNLVDALYHARWAQQPLALILCDIDYFKQYNDTYGHPAGDACLVAVAKALEQCLKRPTDFLARYGGEEFAVILPNTDLAGAIAVVEEMQQTIAALNLDHQSHRSTFLITLSFGITARVPHGHTTSQTLLDQADQALYGAKAAGRNNYRCFSDPEG
jgi:diguanylate cyclase (GGDEF)-like protein/PAS domain S-box-containing protein